MPEARDSKRLLLGVMVAVAIWGSTLALGAFLFGLDEATGKVAFSPNPLRGGIVLACVAFFVGGWALLVQLRQSE
jgi:hypothetical protein